MTRLVDKSRRGLRSRLTTKRDYAAGGAVYVDFPTVAVPMAFATGRDTSVSGVQAVARFQINLGRGQALSGRALSLVSGGTRLPVQLDNASPPWSDGGYRSVTGTVALPGTLAAYAGSATTGVNYNLTAETTDYTPGTAPCTLAQLQAADIKAKFYGPDIDPRTAWVSVNDIIANGVQVPHNTNNPTQYWEQRKSGAVSVCWKFSGYLKDGSTGEFHKWVLADIYVEAFSPTQFEVRGRVCSPNLYGPHPAGTWGGVTSDGKGHPACRHFFELYSGSTLKGALGGPNDPARETWDLSSSFNFDTYVWTKPSTTRMFTGYKVPWQGGSSASGYIDAPIGVMVSGSNLPGNLDPAKVYYPSYMYDSNTFKLYRNRRDYGRGQFVGTHGPDANDIWHPGSYHNGAYENEVLNGKMYYITNMEQRFGQDFQAALTGPGPQGEGDNIIDGEISWHSVTVQITSAGSGNITWTQCILLTTGSGYAIQDHDAHGFWIGSGEPPWVMVKHDMEQLSSKAKLLPHYDPAQASQIQFETITLAQTHSFPNHITQPYDADQGGDDPPDERIGMLPASAVKLLYTPFDRVMDQRIRVQVGNFTDKFNNWRDERRGTSLVCTSNLQHGGTNYPGLAPNNPDIWLGRWDDNGNGNPSFLRAYSTDPEDYSPHGNRYQSMADASHWPNLMTMPYLRSGHPLYWDMMVESYSIMLPSTFGWVPRVTFNGRTFDRATTTLPSLVSPNSGTQLRGNGWATRDLGLCNYFCPATSIYRQMIDDHYKDSAEFVPAWIASLASVAPNWITGGYLTKPYNQKEQLWFIGYFVLALAAEARRGMNPGWKTSLDHAMKHYANPLDSDLGGNLYITGIVGRKNGESIRFMPVKAGDYNDIASDYNLCFTDITALMQANFGNDYATQMPTTKFSAANANDSDPPSPSVQHAEPDKTFNALPEWDRYSPISYTLQTRSILALAADAGSAQAAKLYDRLVARFVASGYPVTMTISTTSYGGYPAAYPHWQWTRDGA